MNKNVKELIDFFESVDLPEEVDMKPHGVIKDVHKYLDSHISIVIKQSGNKAYLPYYERLIRLKEKLSK